MTPLFAYFLIHRFTKSESVTRREVMEEVIFFFSRSVTGHEGHQASTCVLAQAWSNCELFQQLRTCCSRTCCSRCRFSAPAHLLLWMPILSTCALAALDADFEHLRTCCSSCRHLLLWMPVFSSCALDTLDADALQQLRICCSSAREATF